MAGGALAQTGSSPDLSRTMTAPATRRDLDGVPRTQTHPGALRFVWREPCSALLLLRGASLRVWALGHTIRTVPPRSPAPTSTSADRATGAFDQSEATQRLVADRSSACYSHLMTKTIAQRELRNDNAKVIEAVAAGESFVVTRNGVPVAELRPIQQTRRTFVPTAELLVLAATGPRVDRKRFRADLDRVVDQGL